MQLFHHQRQGADWLADRPFAMLLDDQGLGKTITAITVADEAFAWKVLVICPSVVLYNWEHEFGVWSPSRRVQVLLTGRDKINPAADVVIVSHGLMLTPYTRAQILALSWDATILDEAHFFRSPSAKRTQAFYGKWREPMETIVAKSRRVISMTGTPMPNDPSELWTHLFGLAPHRIAGKAGLPISHTAFTKRYCKTKPTPYGTKITGGRNAAELRERIKGFALRRLKSEVLDLPPVRFELVTLRAKRNPLELESIESTFSPKALAELKSGVESTEGAFAAMKGGTEFSRWRRLCGLAKVEPAMDLLLMEMEHGGLNKVVVFAHHSDVVEGLHATFSDARIGTVQITGATPSKSRQQAVTEFQTDPGVRVAICQIVAGGTGVTLTAAQDVVFVEASFVPGENAQAADRIYRIGQTLPCRVRFLALGGTVDEDVTEALRRKTRMIREVLNP